MHSTKKSLAQQIQVYILNLSFHQSQSSIISYTQTHSQSSISAHHRFNEKETDWGFSQFCNHATLTKPIEGSGGKTVLENDSFAIKVFVKEVVDENGALWHNFVEYDFCFLLSSLYLCVCAYYFSYFHHQQLGQ